MGQFRPRKTMPALKLERSLQYLCWEAPIWPDSRSSRPQQTAQHAPLRLLSDGKRLMVNVVNGKPSGLQFCALHLLGGHAAAGQQFEGEARAQRLRYVAALANATTASL